MEGNIVDIALKGIARTGSNQSCEDGLYNEVIGLEWKDGSYVPIRLGDTIIDLTGLTGQIANVDKLWVHKTTNQTNIIIRNKYYNDGGDFAGYQFYWSQKKSDIYVSKDFIFLLKTTEDIDSIAIINNTIRIGDKVFLFKINSYNEIDLSNIEFDMQLDVRRNGLALLHDWTKKKTQKDITDGEDTWEGTWVKQSLNQLESDVKSNDYLTGMAFMRYAIKLYDGTYINLSNPILVSDTLYEELNELKNTFDLEPDSINFTKNENGFPLIVRQIGYLTNIRWKKDYTNYLDDFYDDDKNKFRENQLYERNTMVSGVTFFREDVPFVNNKSIKTAIWNDDDDYIVTYNNTEYESEDSYIEPITSQINGKSGSIMSVNETSYDLRFPNKIDSSPKIKSQDVWSAAYSASGNDNWFAHGNGWFNSEINFEVPGEFCYRAKGLGLVHDGGDVIYSNIYQLFACRNLATPIFKVTKTIPESYKDLVVSVDVFMTRSVSLHENKMDYSGYESNQRKYKDIPKIKKELSDSLTAFYKIYELPAEKFFTKEDGTSADIKEGEVYSPYIKRGSISQIEQQETLEQGYPHFDKYKKGYVYNNRLHISDITTILDSDYTTIQPICIPNNIYLQSEEVELMLRFKIKDEDVEQYIYTTSPINKFKMGSGLFKTEDSYISASIVYPDERALDVTILGYIENNYLYEFTNPETYKLAKSNGFAYYINLNLKYIDLTKVNNGITIPNEYKNNSITRNKNIFKVSSANNLIDFPLINTYQVGNGDIVGFASSTRALSQGQFGQYPLYVFTTEGIYAMEQTTTGTYLSSQPISREVCCNPNGILQLDGSVLFTTTKGLMLLSGVEVVPFAPLLVGEVGLTPQTSSVIGAGEQVYQKAINDTSLVKMNNNISHSDFRDYVSDLDTRLSYIYDKNKVLVYNKKHNYSYLIDLQTQIATKIGEQILFDDGNYPTSSYAITNGSNIELKAIPYKLDSGYTQTMFQTRPIKLGTYDFKSSFRVVVRGKFDVEVGKKAGLYVMGSNDTERWMYLGGIESGDKFYDLGTTIQRVSCKYLMVIYVGSISHDSKINGLEISSNVKYNNKLK